MGKVDDNSCASCNWYDAEERECHWTAPPIVRQLYVVLQAEPATHINYSALEMGPVKSAPDNWCSAWMKKE